MSNALFVAWRFGTDEKGAWSPVGLLEHEEGLYRFRYTKGAENNPHFAPFPGMTDLHEVYLSEKLFPIFSNRLLARSRPEYDAYLTWSGFDPAEQPDPIAILGVTEGIRATDSVEVFPRPVRDERGRYRSRFFLHGLRWIPTSAKEHLESLQAGALLAPMPDPTNGYDAHAVAVRTNEPGGCFMIGYVPRYLAPDVVALLKGCEYGGVELRVVRVNPNAPLQMRLLCSINACWPADFEPCSGEAFQPIASLPPVHRVNKSA